MLYIMPLCPMPSGASLCPIPLSHTNIRFSQKRWVKPLPPQGLLFAVPLLAAGRLRTCCLGGWLTLHLGGASPGACTMTTPGTQDSLTADELDAAARSNRPMPRSKAAPAQCKFMEFPANLDKLCSETVCGFVIL